MIESSAPLEGRRILVPPARPETNPLLDLLARQGADTVSFPALHPGPPLDLVGLEGAAARVEEFDWILFSGSECVRQFLDRSGGTGRARVATIGGGARKELQRRDLNSDYHPSRHTADDVADGFPDPAGRRILLVRLEGAGRDLPRALTARGAEVLEVAGYRMTVAVDPGDRQRCFGAPFDFVALANPTAVRFLTEGLHAVGGRELLAGAFVIAVGEETGKVAEARGLSPSHVSGGRIGDLARDLVTLGRNLG